MNAILNVFLNRESKYNKAIVAALSATISICYILGYPDLAAKVAVIGGALGMTLVGNNPSVPPEDPATGVI